MSNDHQGQGTDPAKDAIAAKLAARRAALAESGHVEEGEAIPPGALGLAFSGGGIRSATISLGVAQALARRGRLLDFDYLSTVSGGGYIGSFLASLFLPDAFRGAADHVPAKPDGDALRLKREFAERVLTDAPDAHEISGTSIRQPVWWLREHSRYLAPNGATDFARAAYYMVRNWLAMLYVFALPILLVFLLSTAGGWWLLSEAHVPTGLVQKALCLIHFSAGTVAVKGCQCVIAGTSPVYVISPLLLLVPVAGFVSLASGLSYWLTENLKLGLVWRKGGSRRPTYPPQFVVFWLVGLTFAGSLAAYWRLGGAHPHGNFLVQTIIRFGEAVALAGAIIATLAVLWTSADEKLNGHAPKDQQRSDAFTIALRAKLTTFGTWWMMAALVLLGLGLVDSAALFAHDRLMGWIKAGTVFPSLVIPVGAWLIKRISAAMSDSEGRYAKILSAYAPIVALIAGILLFGSLAVVGDVVIQSSIWTVPQSWPVSGDPQAMDYAVVRELSVAGLLLLVITGFATGFINLSSLHSLYASRLTRAYLGASNVTRLKRKKGITESDRRDYIDVSRYQKYATAAPLHLINVTLNETLNREGSTLVDRDRKGVPMVFAPEGLFIDAAHGDSGAAKYRSAQPAFRDWDELREQNVESLSVGQLCAISGAAASPGMGARTSLGTALALTFANIRLGYWWDVRYLLRGREKFGDHPIHWLYQRATRVLRTYFYLGNEMLGRYSRDYRRVYLSDGGHFENSGAYELLRRRVKAILVCDNGADPDYHFEDLQNLVRKARIDMGLELRVADARGVTDLFGAEAAALFLNRAGGDWRSLAKDRDLEGFVLLIDVYADGATDPHARILWLKPCLMPDMPEDLVGYAVANEDFPQQTTANQFFNEAQWESYRMLGFVIMDKLLTQSRHGRDILRVAIPRD